MNNKVILINSDNSIIGTEDKNKAHKLGLLHKAFTIYIFNNQGKLLLQKRSDKKNVAGGLWTNSCCGHYTNLKNPEKEPANRLLFEMGIKCKLKKLCTTVYKVRIDKNFIEHEYGEVFIGLFDKTANPNKQEVEDFKWMDLKSLSKDIQKNPKIYTTWFILAFNKLIEHLNSKNVLITDLYKKINSKTIFHVSYPKL